MDNTGIQSERFYCIRYLSVEKTYTVGGGGGLPRGHPYPRVTAAALNPLLL